MAEQNDRLNQSGVAAPSGKIQKGSAKDAVASVGEAKVDAGDKDNRVYVNPALGGSLELPEVGEDGELTSEVFEAGKTHLVDDETAALKVGNLDAFVSADKE
jgi:hypothetical protein